jgi:hypothetical protein
MRALVVLAALLVAGPALAQAPPTLAPTPATQAALMSGLLVQQEAMRQQAIRQQAQLNALSAQLQAQQSIDLLQAESHPAPIPQPDLSRGPPYPQIDASQLAGIPDSILADSNRKVLDAAANHR